MLFLRISLLLFTIVQLNSAIAGSPDEFWQEYQTSTQSGKVRSAVEHVRNLSTKLETDTPQQLQHKKSAILWFMATGGKDGFRKDIATPEEKKIMVMISPTGSDGMVLSHEDLLSYLSELEFNGVKEVIFPGGDQNVMDHILEFVKKYKELPQQAMVK